MSNAEAPRLHFGAGLAVQHIMGSTYEWVDPISGEHLAYVVARPIFYESTLERQKWRAERSSQ